MKKPIVVVMALTFVFGACNEATKQIQNAVNQGVQSVQTIVETTGEKALNLIENQWITGTYEGTLPCASCPGVETKLTLSNDNSFTLVSNYLESKTSEETTQGKYYTDLTNKVIILEDSQAKIVGKLQIKDQQLQYLTPEGTQLEATVAPHYVLKKK